jgi:hypothetical protein
VAGKSVLHINYHAAWQRTELQRVFGDTYMMETDRVTSVYWNTEGAERYEMIRSIYFGDLGVHR